MAWLSKRGKLVKDLGKVGTLVGDNEKQDYVEYDVVIVGGGAMNSRGRPATDSEMTVQVSQELLGAF